MSSIGHECIANVDSKSVRRLARSLSKSALPAAVRFVSLEDCLRTGSAVAVARYDLKLLAVVILFPAEWSGGVQAGQSNSGTRVDELLKMEAQADDGVIHLNNELVEKFAIPGRERRPYSFFIFFDAAHLKDNADLNLVANRAEFGVLATAFLRNNPMMVGQQVFFADLNFVESKRSFDAFRVTTLPHIKYLPSGNGSLEDSESMDWNEEGMVGFVEAKTRQRVGPLETPPDLTKQQIILLVGGLLVALPFVIRRLLAKDTLWHDPKFWVLNILLIYFFIMAGGMLSVIQGIPFLVRDSENLEQLVYFVQGRSTQLGAEGVIISCLYTLVGLLLAFATHFLHTISSKAAQQILLPLVMVISLLAVHKVIALNSWKTGYSVHPYWPRALLSPD